MASCLITTGGTSGTFRLDYDLGATHVVSYYNYGDPIYIDDTATDVTYTTLTGDVTAASGCVTITALVQTCYKLSYERLKANNEDDPTSNFDAIILGATVVPFTDPVSDRFVYMGFLINQVNYVMADPTLKFTSYKVSDSISDGYGQIDLILQVIGSEIPELRIESPNGNLSYIKGTVSADCEPSGYTSIIYCDVPAAP